MVGSAVLTREVRGKWRLVQATVSLHKTSTQVVDVVQNQKTTSGSIAFCQEQESEATMGTDHGKKNVNV